MIGKKMNVITIDGPSASGKGTIGLALATYLDCLYLDTGLIYRQMAFWILEETYDIYNEPSILSICLNKFETFNLNHLGGDHLRVPSISDAASKISTLPGIRDLATRIQRDYVSTSLKWVVVDGRDAGTVVFPNAAIKLFVTASPEIRAQRRYEQLLSKGYEADLSGLTAEISERDFRDQTRTVSPLVPAKDAYILDTSHESTEESMKKILKYIEKYAIV